MYNVANIAVFNIFVRLVTITCSNQK